MTDPLLEARIRAPWQGRVAVALPGQSELALDERVARSIVVVERLAA
jgi:hypothetical protein